MQTNIKPNPYIFLFLLKLGRIFATFGYKPAQMTALSNFSLSVEDSKVNNADLESSATRNFPFPSSVYLSWY